MRPPEKDDANSSSKTKQSVSTSVKTAIKREDKASQNQTKKGKTIYKDQKTGRFKSRPTVKTAAQQAPKLDTKPRLEINATKEYERGRFKAKGSANLKIEPGVVSAGLKGEAKYTLFSKKHQAFKAETNLVNLEGEVSVSNTGVNLSGELKAFENTASISKDICIGGDKFTGTLEASVGPQLGFKTNIGVQKNKSNKSTKIFGVGISRGLVGGKFNLERTENDPQCNGDANAANTSKDDKLLIDTNYENGNISDKPNTAIVNRENYPSPSDHSNRKPAATETSKADEPDESIFPSEEQQQIAAENYLINSGLTAQEAHAVTEEAISEGIELEELVDNTHRIHILLQRADTEGNHQQLIHDYNEFLDISHVIAEKIGCKPLAQISTLIKSGIVIYEASNKFVNIISGIAQGSVLGPIGMIGGAVMNIMGLFMNSGPDPSELIMNRLQDLSKQVADLHESMAQFFKESFRNQAKILEAINKGFEQLSRQLDNRIHEVRTELKASLTTLQDSMDFSIELQKVQARDQLLIPFKKVCEATESWLDGTNDGRLAGKRVPKLSAQLANLVVVDARSSTLTGAGFWYAQAENLKPKLVNTHLLNTKYNKTNPQSIKNISQSLNYNLGFLGCYAKQYSTKLIEPEDLSNIYLWRMAVDYYVALNQSFANFDHDPENRQLDKIIKMGENSLNFINDIKSDAIFWKKLITCYFESLQKVQECIIEYATLKSKALRDERNRIYSEFECEKNESMQQGKIADNLWGVSQLDLLADPEDLISVFCDRTFNNIGSIRTLETTTASGFDWRNPPTVTLSGLSSFTNKTLFSQSVKAHPNLFQKYLCAEYLGLISFTAQQSKTIEGICWKNPVPVPKQGAQGFLRGDNVCKGNSIIVPDSPILNTDINPNINWSIAFRIFVANNQILELCYHGDWSELSGVVIGAYHSGEVKTKNYPDFVCLHAFSSETEEKKYGNHLVKFVENYLNDPHGRTLNLTQFSDSRENEDKIKKDIQKFYFGQRKKIAQDLAEKNDDLLLEKFTNALAKLDMDAKLLQWYAILVGKNIKDTPLDNLLFSEDIKNALREYSNLQEINLERVFIPELWSMLQAFEDHITALLNNSSSNNISNEVASTQNSDLIQESQTNTLVNLNCENLSDFTTKNLAALHPLRLLRTGLPLLESFKSWKLLHLQKFPELTQYTNSEEYELKCRLQREELLRNETYEFFRELNSERFNDAKHKVVHFLEYFAEMPVSEYTQIYMETTRWALQKSRSDVVTGNLALEIDDLLDLKHHQRALYSLQRGWQANIGYLMLLAHKIAGCDFMHTRPINFTMWADGFICFLRLIYNDSLQAVAKAAHNTTTGKMNTLFDLLTVGVDLKNIIYTICFSENLFTELFNRYLQDLNELENAFMQKKNIVNNEPSILRSTKEEVSWNRLDIYALVLRLYLDLLFSFEIERFNDFRKKLELKDKNQLFDHLKKTINSPGGRKDTLLGELQHYRKHVQEMGVLTQQKIIHAQNFLLFWYHLQTYFKNNWPCSFLKINDSNLFSNMTFQKISLILEFLKINDFIDSIEINDIQIDLSAKDNLVLLLTELKKYPHMKNFYVTGSTINHHLQEIIIEHYPNAMLITDSEAPGKKMVTKPVESLIQKTTKKPRHISNSAAFFPIKSNLESEYQPQYQLPLNLHVGPPLLNNLFELGKKAGQALLQRLHREECGMEMHAQSPTGSNQNIEAKYPCSFMGGKHQIWKNTEVIENGDVIKQKILKTAEKANSITHNNL